jgi:hypothetical protein
MKNILSLALIITQVSIVSQLFANESADCKFNSTAVSFEKVNDNDACLSAAASIACENDCITSSSGTCSFLTANAPQPVEIIDNFSSYKNSYFFTDNKKYSDSNRDVYIKKGKLIFYLTADVGSSYTENFDQISGSADYTVEATFSISGTKDPHGLVFGGKGSSDSYRALLDVENGGYLALKKYTDGDWITIVEYERSNVINTKPGKANTIKVEKYGKNVNVYVNGTILISNLNLPDISGKTFGFFCQTIKTKLSVDDFKLVGVSR